MKVISGSNAHYLSCLFSHPPLSLHLHFLSRDQHKISEIVNLLVVIPLYHTATSPVTGFPFPISPICMYNCADGICRDGSFLTRYGRHGESAGGVFSVETEVLFVSPPLASERTALAAEIGCTGMTLRLIKDILPWRQKPYLGHSSAPKNLVNLGRRRLNRHSAQSCHHFNNETSFLLSHFPPTPCVLAADAYKRGDQVLHSIKTLIAIVLLCCDCRRFASVFANLAHSTPDLFSRFQVFTTSFPITHTACTQIRQSTLSLIYCRLRRARQSFATCRAYSVKVWCFAIDVHDNEKMGDNEEGL